MANQPSTEGLPAAHVLCPGQHNWPLQIKQSFPATQTRLQTVGKQRAFVWKEENSVIPEKSAWNQGAKGKKEAWAAGHIIQLNLQEVIVKALEGVSADTGKLGPNRPPVLETNSYYRSHAPGWPVLDMTMTALYDTE